MIWNELIKNDVEFIVKYINKESVKYISFDGIADKLQVEESKIVDYLNEYGYIKKKNSLKFEKSMYAEQLIKMNDPKHNALQFLINELDTLKDLVEMYKKKDNKLINTKLPDGEIKGTTIRVNKTVWDMFNSFSDDLDYTKHELISMALLEFIDKYKL